MANEFDETTEVLRGIWQTAPADLAELDEECSPNKACRNMKDVSFDGFAEDGVDMGTAWRNKLRREGKLGGSSLAELIRETS
jgi:hypothetical protein